MVPQRYFLFSVAYFMQQVTINQMSLSIAIFSQDKRPPQLKHMFTFLRPRHFFLPHQKVVFWLFEGKFSFFLNNSWIFRKTEQICKARRHCSHRIALLYQYAMFWTILYCYSAIVHRCDHAKQMAAVSDSLGKKFTTTQNNWCGHLMRIGKKVIAL